MDKPDDDTPDPDAYRPGEFYKTLANQPPQALVERADILALTKAIDYLGSRFTTLEDLVDLVKLRLENLASKVERWNS